jgi:hypothetical protein
MTAHLTGSRAFFSQTTENGNLLLIIEGIGLPLPDRFDDFDQTTDHLSPDHQFKYLCVLLTCLKTAGCDIARHETGLAPEH